MARDGDKFVKRFIKPSFLIALGLTAAAAGWILTGDLEQAKRYYAARAGTLSGSALDGSKAAQTADQHSEQAAAKGDAASAGSGKDGQGEDGPGEDGAGDDKEARLPAVRVRMLNAREHVRQITVLGRTEAIKDADVRAETSGKITKVKARKGQWLKKGDVILEVSMGDLKARLKEAKARVKYGKVEFEAARKLAKKRYQSAVRVAEEEAELAQAEADLAAVKLDIAHKYVRAPIDGFMDTLPLSVGDYLNVGDTVGVIVNPNPMRVIAQITERDVGSIKKSNPATAKTPDGYQIDGEVKYIALQGNDATRTFRVDVWVDNKDFKLRGGQTMELRLPAGAELAHRVSPAVLTLNDRGIIGIKAVDKQSIVRFYPAEMIADTPDGMWLAGLPEELTLITVGQEFVAEGQKVRPVFEDDGATETKTKPEPAS